MISPTNNKCTNTLILIFGYVVWNKIYLIFQRLQKKTFKNFYIAHPFTPPLLVALSGFPYYEF